jgi:hypothetical protein
MLELYWRRAKAIVNIWPMPFPCPAAGDEPLAPLSGEADPPTPIFSFCKLANFSDIMLPNTIEGDVFLRPPEKRAFRPKSRAGACFSGFNIYVFWF